MDCGGSNKLNLEKSDKQCQSRGVVEVGYRPYYISENKIRHLSYLLDTSTSTYTYMCEYVLHIFPKLEESKVKNFQSIIAEIAIFDSRMWCTHEKGWT